MVELRSNKPGFKGAWYVAKILESYSHSNPKRKIWVEYKNDSNQTLTVSVDISFIRPLPPPPAADQTYELHDVVEALCGNGWWKGVVSEVSVMEESKRRTRYSVVLENPYQELDFSSADLRFHLDWTDGGWVRPPKQEIINIEDCEKQSEHVHNTETEETFSTLMKSTEQVTDSTLAKFSSRDSGANQPLNRGKNSSPNQQEAGPENRMGESSKKRERELNAQVTGHKVAAAGGMVRTSSAGPFADHTANNDGEEQSSVKKSGKNLLEHSPYLNTRSRSKKQKIPAPEIEKKTLPNYPNKFRKNSANPLSPDECRATLMLMNSAEQVTDIAISKGLTFDTSRDLKLAGSNSPNKGKNSETPDTTDCEQQLEHVDNTANHSKVVHETEGTLSNHAKEFRKENSVISLTPTESTESTHSNHAMKSTEQVTESTLTKCSTRDSGTNLPLSKGKNTSSNQQEVGQENRTEESSKKKNRELNVQGTSQKVAVADSEPVKNQELPFTKSSFVWNYIDSLEVLRFLPQKPHFRPLLSEHNEAIREGSAIGHMLTFVTLVEKAWKLEIENPTSLFDSYLEALADLEMFGFDVKAVVDGITGLLSFKRRQDQLENRSEEFHEKIAECDGERAKLEEEINEIDKAISELEERRAMKVSRKVKEDSKSDYLKYNASTIKDNLLFLKEKFKVKAAALGAYVIEG